MSANFEAELILGKKRYKTAIENFSENGILMTNPEKISSIEVIAGTTIDLELDLISPETLKPTGERAKLSCKVLRVKKTHDGIINSIGLEIIEKSPEYEEFLKILYSLNWNISD
ncbi:MAG: PilZ domain-containing protein [Nitrospirae bacterium]|nr:PilZ domain-containing protein [Nitrospirota bacterium]